MLYNVESHTSNELMAAPIEGGLVSNIVANFTYTSFVLSWVKSPDPAVDKYIILYKMQPESGSYNGTGLTYTGDPDNTSSPIHVPVNSLLDANNPSIELQGILMDTPYWFAIIAVNQAQDESAIVTMNGNITPTSFALAAMSFAAPAGVKFRLGADNSITFTWQTVS